ncbi:Receptor-type tyrosine-protein phosphatase mu [Labeo rohita]|uniref:Receptor-type tyrosine-protein phosphatase mu n=1 Tax=Labeo rohita TaxID=84645 RepID=A0ABQ8L1I6_LABRO|nr:Receptor-type tyrosine-protein phosphatase mu [Labeo rohita]
MRLLCFVSLRSCAARITQSNSYAVTGALVFSGRFHSVSVIGLLSFISDVSPLDPRPHAVPCHTGLSSIRSQNHCRTVHNERAAAHQPYGSESDTQPAIPTRHTGNTRDKTEHATCFTDNTDAAPHYIEPVRAGLEQAETDSQKCALMAFNPERTHGQNQGLIQRLGFDLSLTGFRGFSNELIVTVGLASAHVCICVAPCNLCDFPSSGSAFMMVNTSGRVSGQRAQLYMPQFKENDTHCVIFHYYGASREGSSPGQLFIYVKENNSPLGVAVWNSSGPAFQKWQQVELAISTFWPNFYQWLVFDDSTPARLQRLPAGPYDATPISVLTLTNNPDAQTRSSNARLSRERLLDDRQQKHPEVLREISSICRETRTASPSCGGARNQICTPSCVLRSVSANCVVFCEWPVMISGLLALLSTGPSLELLLCLQLWHRHKILHAQYEEEENMRGTAPQGPLMSVVHLVFEVVASGERGLLAINGISRQGHQCMNTPHFLHIKSVEVNARQTATFQCTINGQPKDHVNYKLWLQGIGGREATLKDTKPVNSRRYTATFDIVNTTKGDLGHYRCIVRSEKGVGVSSYGALVVKQPPIPIAPPQLTAVGATYLWIQLNANSINGDGPIIEKEVEYRTLSGSLIDSQPVDKPNHKIGHLDPDTEYEISVLLTRPNEGGTGAPGPPLRARTKCAGESVIQL